MSGYPVGRHLARLEIDADVLRDRLCRDRLAVMLAMLSTELDKGEHQTDRAHVIEFFLPVAHVDSGSSVSEAPA